MVQQRQDDGRFPLRMPESIYTAVIVGWLNVRVKSGDCFIAGVMFGPLVLAGFTWANPKASATAAAALPRLDGAAPGRDTV